MIYLLLCFIVECNVITRVIAAPTGDEPLTPDDAVKVLEIIIIEAQNQSQFLGLKLKVPDYIVTSIHTQYTDPKYCLYYVLMEFLKQVKPRPTWRGIIEALRSPLVNLPQLAMKVEAAHFPDPKATNTDRRTPLRIPPQQGVVKLSVRIDFGSQMTIKYVEKQIKRLEKRFHALKKASRECLQRHEVPVKRIVSFLISLPADDVDEHKQFLESRLNDIYYGKVTNHSQLFVVLDLYWNYQNYQLLDYLIQDFKLEAIKSDMNMYKKYLQQFRKKTPLKLFCESQRRRHIKPPQEFHKMVVKFDWPDDVTLEVVEEFQQEYASHYRLREYAMMLDVIIPGSFIVTWFIPGSIVEKLKAKVLVSILRKHSVTNLQISGELVYPKPMEKVKDYVQFAGAHPEMSEIVAKNENAIAVVTEVEEALESGDVTTGYRLFGDTKRSSISIVEETEHLPDVLQPSITNFGSFLPTTEMSEIVVKTENVIAVIAQAKTALESGDVSTGYQLFGDAKRSGISIMRETEYLLERVSAVEKHYKELEEAKSREIGELYKKETETQQNKEGKLALMRLKESELQQAQSELNSATARLDETRRRKEEAERRKRASMVGAGVFTVLTLGLGAPALLGTAAFVAMAADANSDENKAKGDIYNAKTKISPCEVYVSQYRGEIHQLDNEIAALSQQICRLKSEQEKIHAQRGEVNDIIKYLRDVLYFWKQFSQLTEHETPLATFLQKLTEYLGQHNKQTTSIPQHVRSYISSWECVEKILEKAKDHISINFTCQFCHNSFHSLPHLRDGKFCCSDCFTI